MRLSNECPTFEHFTATKRSIVRDELRSAMKRA
jgi:hypothetical protein